MADGERDLKTRERRKRSFLSSLDGVKIRRAPSHISRVLAVLSGMGSRQQPRPGG